MLNIPSSLLATVEQLYRLNIAGYTGTAGDSLDVHNDLPFTTKDRDNDLRSDGNCASIHRGAWWYNSCHNSNLNGLYLRMATEVLTGFFCWKTLFFEVCPNEVTL